MLLTSNTSSAPSSIFQRLLDAEAIAVQAAAIDPFLEVDAYGAQGWHPAPS
jgi:hypothetical protein